MSTDYRAYAVLGCEVTGKLYRDVTVSTPCVHGGLGSHSKVAPFCPQCGKRQTKVEKRPIEHYDENDMVLNGLKVEHAGYLGNSRDHIRSFAGIVVMAEVGNYAIGMAIPINGFDERAEIVRSALEEIGMWDPDSFGLWALLSVG